AMGFLRNRDICRCLWCRRGRARAARRLIRRRQRGRGSRCKCSAFRPAMRVASSSVPHLAPRVSKSILPSRARRPSPRRHFYAELASHISGRIGSNRDVLLYVHGFNTSYDEARFRLAQIAADARFGGVAVLYTWPAAGSLLDYGAAKESATIARDALSKLIH